mmetsp:Transcript_20824/g.65484  ORF Transcript_20824/g.65484 Transcript_20824/m.65484 type:complete len:210 (-) Transcript_20824:668-1297(-)
MRVSSALRRSAAAASASSRRHMASSAATSSATRSGEPSPSSEARPASRKYSSGLAASAATRAAPCARLASSSLAPNSLVPKTSATTSRTMATRQPPPTSSTASTGTTAVVSRSVLSEARSGPHASRNSSRVTTTEMSRSSKKFSQLALASLIVDSSLRIFSTQLSSRRAFFEPLAGAAGYRAATTSYSAASSAAVPNSADCDDALDSSS